jgi:hypothetical protein
MTYSFLQSFLQKWRGLVTSITNMANFSCLPVNSSLGCLAKSLGALKPVPWEKVKVISKYLHLQYEQHKSNVKFTNCANIIRQY